MYTCLQWLQKQSRVQWGQEEKRTRRCGGASERGVSPAAFPAAPQHPTPPEETANAHSGQARSEDLASISLPNPRAHPVRCVLLVPSYA